MNSLNIQRIPYAEDENSHVVDTKTTLSFNPTKDFKYVRTNKFYLFLSALFHFLIYPILWLFIGKMYYGIRVKGKRNAKKIKKTGAVICFNHVFMQDSSMICPFALFPKMPYYIASPIGFKMPVVKTMLKYLRAVPVPESTSAMKSMYSQVLDMLKKGGMLAIAPEGSEWPYYGKIRKFKKGAFTLAKNANVPILPIVYTYRKQSGIWAFKKRPTIDMNILPPIFPVKDGQEKSAEMLLNECHTLMQETFETRLRQEEEKLQRKDIKSCI